MSVKRTGLISQARMIPFAINPLEKKSNKPIPVQKKILFRRGRFISRDASQNKNTSDNGISRNEIVLDKKKNIVA
jgi:hypothetical protein